MLGSLMVLAINYNIVVAVSVFIFDLFLATVAEYYFLMVLVF